MQWAVAEGPRRREAGGRHPVKKWGTDGGWAALSKNLPGRPPAKIRHRWYSTLKEKTLAYDAAGGEKTLACDAARVEQTLEYGAADEGVGAGAGACLLLCECSRMRNNEDRRCV